MSRKRSSVEDIVNKLREADVLIARPEHLAGLQADRGHGSDVLPVAQGVWRAEDRPGPPAQELERENSRLKRLLADAELDKAILREAANPNF